MLSRYLRSLPPDYHFDESPPTMSYIPQDTATHIEDRWRPGRFYDRALFGGTWQGTDARHTWVPELGVPLGATVPPYVPQHVREDRHDTYAPQHTRQPRNNAPSHGWGYAYGPTPSFAPPPPRMQPPPMAFGDRYGGTAHRPQRSRSPRPRQVRDPPLGNGIRRDNATQRRRNRSPPIYRDYSPSGHTSTSQSQGSSTRYSESRRNSPSPPPQRARSPPPTRGKKKRDRKGRNASNNMKDNTRRLRDVALRSKNQWARTVYPPPIADATKDPDGHPWCPLETNVNDPDDYGSDTDDPVLPSNWVATENQRRAEAGMANPDGYSVARPPAPPDAGVWCEVAVVRDAEQAANLFRWVRRTEPSAYAFLMHHCAMLENFPTIPRTAGDLCLLAGVGRAKGDYWERVTGRRFPPHGPAKPNVALDKDVIMDPEHIYVGSAALGENVTSVLTSEREDTSGTFESGTHRNLRDAVHAYEVMPCRDWPLGFRVDDTHFANLADEYASPLPGDVRAWHTIGAVAPRRDRKTSSYHRAQFLGVLLRVLSIPGTYHRIANFGQYPDADLPLEHYPFLCNNVTESLVVAWLIQHGIRKEGEAIRTLEDFARARRNLREGFNVVKASSFNGGGWPHSTEEMLTLPQERVTDWGVLTHAALQPGVASTYPQAPAATPNPSGGSTST
ncbi:hypothetical protein R3P38DRAFT_3177277 [Favolaschia claudopus]|uniref:Uncharacterized protein n=1 Tax=Favolaschia claudopus TaxID=2862362 RepID=A0AAW0CYW0_9AGAR